MWSYLIWLPSQEVLGSRPLRDLLLCSNDRLSGGKVDLLYLLPGIDILRTSVLAACSSNTQCWSSVCDRWHIQFLTFSQSYCVNSSLRLVKLLHSCLH